MDENKAETLSVLTGRIERLERRLSAYRLIAFLLLFAGSVYWVTIQVANSAVTVKKILLESHEVKLVDADGQTRFFLRLYSKVPILQLIDSKGKPRLSLGLRFDDTPFIDLSGKDGDTRAVFEITPEDEPTLRFLDQNGETSFQIN